mgnify:CR=1 FL=1
MSDGAGSEVEVSSEGGSDAERFEEAASQVNPGCGIQEKQFAICCLRVCGLRCLLGLLPCWLLAVDC